MSSLKELHQEILKTQQDIAVTYGRVVGMETELKKKLSEDNTSGIEKRLDELHLQLQSIVNLLNKLKNTQEDNTPRKLTVDLHEHDNNNEGTDEVDNE